MASSVSKDQIPIVHILSFHTVIDGERSGSPILPPGRVSQVTGTTTKPNNPLASRSQRHQVVDVSSSQESEQLQQLVTV